MHVGNEQRGVFRGRSGLNSEACSEGGRDCTARRVPIEVGIERRAFVSGFTARGGGVGGKVGMAGSPGAIFANALRASRQVGIPADLMGFALVVPADRSVLPRAFHVHGAFWKPEGRWQK